MNVDEIRANRIIESEKTYGMTYEELQEYSKSKQGAFMKKVLENKKQKDKSKIK